MASGGSGCPTGWRTSKGENNKSTALVAGEGCPFCTIQQMADDEALIVARGTLVYAVLNLYPYNSAT